MQVVGVGASCKALNKSNTRTKTVVQICKNCVSNEVNSLLWPGIAWFWDERYRQFDVVSMLKEGSSPI